jgi:hypothetical protein
MIAEHDYWMKSRAKEGGIDEGGEDMPAAVQGVPRRIGGWQ